MKNTMRILVLLLLGLSVTFFIGCEEDEDEVIHALVGTWEMTNMAQAVSYATADASLGYPIGTVLGGGSADWTILHGGLGVEATAEIYNDGTYSLSGTFPVSNDTLGGTTTATQLDDAGTWEANDDLTALLLEGTIYVIPPSGEMGAITVDDAAAPTTIDMTYSADTVDSMYVFVSAYSVYVKTAIAVSSTTTLGFTKQ